MNLNDYTLFRDNKTTLKETSKDDSDKMNVQYLTESNLSVVDFDRVKTCYANQYGCSEEAVASVDALTVWKNQIAFVEFKNGKVNNRNIKDKLRDSLLIFGDITGSTVLTARENAVFIVVYNQEKNPLPNQQKKEKTQDSVSRNKIGDYIAGKANKELILFDLERYMGLYFREVHAYTQEQFADYLGL